MGTEASNQESSKQLEIREQIYLCQEERERLQLELETERFHQSYIPQRKKLTRGRFLFNLPLIFLLTIFVIGSFLLLTVAVTDSEFASRNAALILGAVLWLAFGGYADIKLMISEIYMFRMMRVRVSEKSAMIYAAKKGINTFQNDAIRTRQKIELLEGELAALDSRILQLTGEQRILQELACPPDLLAGEAEHAQD